VPVVSILDVRAGLVGSLLADTNDRLAGAEHLPFNSILSMHWRLDFRLSTFDSRLSTPDATAPGLVDRRVWSGGPGESGHAVWPAVAVRD